jgi:hypothetical protein
VALPLTTVDGLISTAVPAAAAGSDRGLGGWRL